MSLSRRGGLVLLALLGAVAPAQGPVPQRPLDWDTVAGNLLLTLLVGGHIEPVSKEDRTHLKIAVIGDDRFGKAVAVLARDKQVRQPKPLPLTVLALAEKDLLQRRQELLACDVIVFATADDKVMQQVITAVAERPILLCSRSPGFLAAGGHLQLWLSDENKPRYELADKVLAARGIKVTIAAVKASQQAPRPPSPKQEGK